MGETILYPALEDNIVTLAKMASGTDGNMITYDASGNPAAVATGTAGQVLTSAGAGAPPTFADAGGGAWNFISSQTVSGTPAYVTFESGISSTYKNYVITFSGVKVSSGGYNYIMQVGTGGTYTTSSNYNWTNITNNGTSTTNYGSNSQTSMRIANAIGIDAGRFEACSGMVRIYNIFEADATVFTWDTVTGENSSKRHIRSVGSGGVELNTSFNNIRFGPTGGTHTAGGRFSLYGISES